MENDHKDTLTNVNNSLLVFKQTSETNKQILNDTISNLKLKKYSETFLQELEQLGIKHDILTLFRDCCTTWQYKQESDGSNWNLFLNACRKRGCPVCNKTSINSLMVQYENMFKNKGNLRRNTYTWKKSGITDQEIKRRMNNLKALDKRLYRAGYRTETAIRSVEWTDHENTTKEQGINFHIHELRCSWVDLDHLDQPVRDIEVKNKQGKTTYKGPCGLFEQIKEGKRVLQLDGFLNVWVLGVIWNEITGDSYRVFTEKIYDSEEGLFYVLKYAVKSPSFKFAQNCYDYMTKFKHKKSVYRITQDKELKKIKYPAVELKVLNADTEKKFEGELKVFDIENDTLRESRCILRYQYKKSKQFIKDIKFTKFGWMREFQSIQTVKFNQDQELMSETRKKIIQNKYIFEIKNNWELVEKTFNFDEIEQLKRDGDIWLNQTGYHLV